MIREFNQKWEKDYERKTAETLQTQTDRRRIARRKVNDSDGEVKEGSDLDELLGISTASMDFDVSSVEGEDQLQAYIQTSMGKKCPVALLATCCGSKSLKVILIDSDFRGYPVFNPLVTLYVIDTVFKERFFPR